MPVASSNGLRNRAFWVSTHGGTGQRWGRARALPAETCLYTQSGPKRNCIDLDTLWNTTRRELLVAVLVSGSLTAKPARASGAGNQVGAYLPPSEAGPDFVEFVPDKNKTPAIRAGTVDKYAPYRFALPKTWTERKVANIASGNYCQPRCAEPWTEVIFADDMEGTAKVLASPLVRLTNEKNAGIEDIGTPETFITAVGPFVTGTFLDLEEVNSMSAEKASDGLVYYYYDIYSTNGLVGPHLLTAATVKGDLALLFIVAADEKQYGRSKKKLATMLRSFKA